MQAVTSIPLSAKPLINRYFVAFLALFIIPISGLSIDIYVPSLPEVGNFFHTTQALSQLTITAFVLGMGLMQIFSGSISDSFGRKKPFLIALFFYLIATLFIPWSHQINELLVLRFFQGVMVAVMVVPMRSVITDLFEGRELYKMVNYMTTAWSIGPIIAPYIGGHLQQWMGWQASFYFLAIYSVISFLLISFLMPETSVYKHAFHLKSIMKRYSIILTHRAYINSFLMNSLLYSFILLFAVVGPFLIQNVLHYSVIEFGRIALVTGLAWFLGTLTNRFLIHVSLHKKASIVLSLMLVVSLMMMAESYWLPLTAYGVVIPVVILLWLAGIIFPNYFAKAVSYFPEMTGSANALLSSAVFLISGGISIIATFLKSTSALPLSMVYFVLILLSLMIHYYRVRE